MPWKDVIKDPVKNRLAWEAFVVIDETSAAAPARPPKGGADHEDAFASQTATADAGEENWPPAQSLLFVESQKRAFTGPLGPPVPRAENVPEAGL